MNEITRQRLLKLNRDFYATIAPDFDATRQGWTPGLLRVLDYLPAPSQDGGLTVLDVGCANGRFAHILHEYVVKHDGFPAHYTGVDNDARLLAFAQESTVSLSHLQTHFFQADLAQEGWSDVLDEAQPFSDVVLCTATLHHLPGYDLRVRVVREMAFRTRKMLVISAWQFLASARFRQKLIPWEQIGLSAGGVEPGDALLPWKQGQFAVRYVHQLDEAELRRLATDASLTVIDTYRADGKEGNLNLYMVMQK